MPAARSPSTLFALAALWAAGAHSVQAQHGTTGYGAMPMVPRTNVMLEHQTAQFDLPGRAGVWQTWGPRLEYLALPWLSVSLRAGVARIDYADGAGAFGPADSELAVRALALTLPRLDAVVTAGLSGELPTGDADLGTGNGHFSLLPFATFATMPSRTFMFHVMAGDRVVLGDAGGEHAHHGVAHGSVIMPHSEHELAVHGGITLTFGTVVISPGLEWMQVLAPPGDTFLTGQLEVALVPRSQLRIAVAFDAPLLDEPRFEWRGRLMAALVL